MGIFQPAMLVYRRVRGFEFFVWDHTTSPPMQSWPKPKLLDPNTPSPQIGITRRQRKCHVLESHNSWNKKKHQQQICWIEDGNKNPLSLWVSQGGLRSRNPTPWICLFSKFSWFVGFPNHRHLTRFFMEPNEHTW